MGEEVRRERKRREGMRIEREANRTEQNRERVGTRMKRIEIMIGEE